jgi:hypothetical protein
MKILRRLAWPLACYLGMTVGVPLLDGTPLDGEHLATILATAVAAAAAFAALERGAQWALKNYRRLS